MTETDRIAVEARITGRVQGVWYRAWTRQEARRLGLAGWVRNAPDGAVEALFVGPEARVREMLALCSGGPPAARVAQVESRSVEPVPAVTGFEAVR
jgi:acylphosphatase